MVETLQRMPASVDGLEPFARHLTHPGEEPEPRVDDDDREDPPEEEEEAEPEPTVDPPDKDPGGRPGS